MYGAKFIVYMDVFRVLVVFAAVVALAAMAVFMSWASHQKPSTVWCWDIDEIGAS